METTEDNNAPGAAARVVVFTLDGQRFALPLDSVMRVIPSVELGRLPRAPAIVIGAVNYRGRVIPVVDIRGRFEMALKEISLSDRLIISQTPKRTLAILVDDVVGVAEPAYGQVVPAKEVLPGLEYVEGVIKDADGLIIIHDLDRFLSIEEGTAIDEALKGV